MQICKDYLNHTLDLTLSTPGLVCCCVDMIIIHGATWLLTPGLSGILSSLLTLAARIQTHNLPHIASHCHKLGLGQEKKIGNRTRPFVIKEEGTFLTFKLMALSARAKVWVGNDLSQHFAKIKFCATHLLPSASLFVPASCLLDSPAPWPPVPRSFCISTLRNSWNKDN